MTLPKTHAKPRGRATARKHLPKATTFRIDPKNQEGLALLGRLRKTPLNRIVNAAVGMHVRAELAREQADLESTLDRVKAYRNRDPRFDRAIAAFVDAEASNAKEDPVEGVPVKGVAVKGAPIKSVPVKAGPAQTKVRQLLRG